MKLFNLENQYQIYLETAQIKESDMHPIQKIEMKRAFMGACGQLLILFRDELALYSEDEGVILLQQLEDEVLDYWDEECKKGNDYE